MVASSHRVEGVVVDSSGQRISAATIVQSFCPNGRMPCNDGLQRVYCSDKAGRFAFELPTEGLYIIVAFVNGFMVGHLDVVVPMHGSEILRITVRKVAEARSLNPGSRPCVRSAE